MVKLKTAHCPRCGAEVKLDAKLERAVCTFCGTTSYAEHMHRTVANTVVVKAGRTVWLSLMIALLSLGIAGMGVFSALHEPAHAPAQRESARPVLPTPSPPAAVELPAPVEQPDAKPELRVSSYASARLVDSDGDAREELLVPVEQTLRGQRSAHFGVFSFPQGTLLRLTAPLAEAERALIAVAHGRLLLAHPDGQLQAYDLASGDAQWTSALGERVAALCEAAANQSDALHVTTDDGRNLLLDVKTGRQSPTRAPCKVPLAIAAGRHQPSDRRDYRAPREVQAFLCGSVRVMGSDNYTVPDACKARAKVDSDRLDGMVGHAVWSFGREALVFGVRKPGTYVPMVGLYERGRWRWKSELPVANPLEAEQGGPRVISLRGSTLLIAYASGRPERHYVTQFDARSGVRAWTAALPADSGPVNALVQNEQAMAVHASAVYVLSQRDGAPLATLGTH